MRIHSLVLLILGSLLLTIGGWFYPPFAVTARPAQSGILDAYPIGNPTLTDLWVDPTNGRDDATGAARDHALATIGEAWRRIPSGTPLTGTGYRIQLVAGDYPESNFPEYWNDRHGSAQFPIILQAADGARSARLLGDLNLYSISYFYILGLTLQHSGDVFHCEQCDHVLIRDSALIGSRATSHENVKVNQSQHIYLEGNDIGGAEQNAIDFVAVQYGHILHNHIHHADDWCMYLKGGSAHLRIEGNEIDTCGTGGFTAGEGTGFEYMVAPWLHYEAYDLKVVNNVIHDTDGAGLGVNGGYDILFAYNTLYRIGARSHVLEFVFGGRSCDGDQALAGRCAANLAAGGWGTVTVGDAEPIPNRNIYVYNNLIYNPPGYQSQWQHLAIYGPRTPGNGSNIATPAQADVNLVMRGNIIWNGPADHPLGIGEDTGCQPGNPTCNTTQLLADNAINTIEPALLNPSQGDFRPALHGNLASVTTYALPSFPAWDTFTPAVAAGDLTNSAPVDRNGVARSEPGIPGAYAHANSTPVATGTLPAITPPAVTNTATATTSAAVTATATPINTSIATLPAPGNAAFIYLPAIAQRAANLIPATLTATPTSPAIGTLTATPTTTITPTVTPTSTSTAVTATATTTAVATATPTTTATTMSPGTATATSTATHTIATATPTATATQTSTAPAPLSAGPVTLVMLGDSLTEGQGDDSLEGGGYPRRLLASVQAQRAGTTATNLGKSGWTAADVIAGVNNEPPQLTQAVTQLQGSSGAKLALVWIGSNDLWYLYEYGNPTTADELQDVQNFTAHIDTILSQLTATGATVFLALLDDQSQRPVVADPPNPSEPAFTGISEAERQRMSQQVIAYNNALRTKAAQYGAYIVDFSNTTLFITPATLADDGNHPNAAGYEIISEGWWQEIEPFL